MQFTYPVETLMSESESENIQPPESEMRISFTRGDNKVDEFSVESVQQTSKISFKGLEITATE